MLKYTLCFILDHPSDTVLMLLRKYEPNADLWNGVGGKIKPGELPLASCLREVEEETGIRLASAGFTGTVTWSDAPETGNAGMYVYLAYWPEHIPRSTVDQKETDEGLLSWQPLDTILHNRWADVVDNIPLFLPAMIAMTESPDLHPLQHRCHYEDGRLLRMTWDRLPAEVIALATQETATV